MTLSAGTRLGPYEITQLIGVGGMGEVYRALDTRLNRIVAIKRLTAQVDRFEQEDRTIAALNHPHICQIHDIGPDYLVLERRSSKNWAMGRPLGPRPDSSATTTRAAISTTRQSGSKKSSHSAIPARRGSSRTRWAAF